MSTGWKIVSAAVIIFAAAATVDYWGPYFTKIPVVGSPVVSAFMSVRSTVVEPVLSIGGIAKPY